MFGVGFRLLVFEFAILPLLKSVLHSWTNGNAVKVSESLTQRSGARTVTIRWYFSVNHEHCSIQLSLVVKKPDIVIRMSRNSGKRVVLRSNALLPTLQAHGNFYSVHRPR